MNVVPGSAFFQTVQGIAGGTNGSRPVPPKEQAPEASAAQRQRGETIDFQQMRQLRPGPPGTNLDITI